MPVAQHCGVDIDVGDDDTADVNNATETTTNSLTPKSDSQKVHNNNNRGSAPSSRNAPASLAQTPPLSEVGIPRREEVQSPQQPKSLQQEFLLVNFDVNNVKVTEVGIVVWYSIHHTLTITGFYTSRQRLDKDYVY